MTISINRTLKVLLIALVIFLCMPIGSVYGFHYSDGRIYVELDGHEIEFAKDPFIESGTTLVQFRPLFEAMGLEVGWDGETQTVTGSKGSFNIELRLGEKTARVNGKKIELPVAARAIDGHTMVPIRFVAESTGRAVHWQAGHYKRVVSIHRTIAADIYDILYGGELVYAGESQDGLSHGSGKYLLQDQVWYEGQFVEGVMEGEGKLYHRGELIYEGEFANNLPNGTGKLMTSGIYEGELKDGLRHGFGKLSDSNGNIRYEGQFEGNNITGIGMIYESNGWTYVGDVIMGVREGFGAHYDADGDLFYEGVYAGNHPGVPREVQLALAVYLYEQQEKQEKADEKWRELLERTQDEAQAYYYLAQVYFNYGEMEQAAGTLEKVIELSPEHVDSYVMLAVTLAMIDQKEEALQAVDQAEKLDAEELGYDLEEIRQIIEQISHNSESQESSNQ